MSRVLLVDDKENIREVLKDILESAGYLVDLASCAQEALEIVNIHFPDIVLTDINMPGKSGIELLHDLKEKYPDIPVILITAYGSIDSAVLAMKQGAYDYLTKPIDYDYLTLLIERALERSQIVTENSELKKELNKINHRNMIGESVLFKKVLELIEVVSPRSSNVLIQGECGTGKELVARSIYNNSSTKSFVVVDCASLPEDLLESELFGYEKGAFTGAVNSKDGRIALADGGTLFLDEVGELSVRLQAKLLRVIQEKEFTPLGSLKPRKVDFRLIAATNRDLKKEIDKGGFRSDLYYRLNVVSINVPPLRDRKEDIPLLVNYFIHKLCQKDKISVKSIGRDVLSALCNYSWPGNIRELENVIERMIIVSQSNELLMESLPLEILPESNYDATTQFHLDRLERETILKALNKVNWNKSEASKILNIGRKALYNKIEKYNLDK